MVRDVTSSSREDRKRKVLLKGTRVLEHSYVVFVWQKKPQKKYQKVQLSCSTGQGETKHRLHERPHTYI